jgi:hypothetical protein
VEHHGIIAYPIDDRGHAQLDHRLSHAAGKTYELVDWPGRKRHLRAEFMVPLCWPDGSPYATDVLRVDLDVADRDVKWDEDYVANRTLSDGREVTLRLPMRAWREKNLVRVAHAPVVVDVAAISPP